MKGARALTPLEVQAVCMAFEGKYAIRNQALFLLCANIGTRITEALKLNVGDVVQNGEVVEVLYLRRETVKGKGAGVALTLPEGARNALVGLIAWKREVGQSLDRDAPLFLSEKGGRLTRQQAHNIFKAAYKKVGLKGQVTTHSPRKTFAKTVYHNSGNNLLVTQQALRHTSIEMTLYYLDTLKDEVTKALPNFDFATGVDEINKTSNPKVIVFPTRRKAKSK